MLRLVDPNRTQTVTILDTEFQMRSISVRDKFSIIEQLSALKAQAESFDQMVDTLCRAIHSISADENVKKVLNEVERIDDVVAIMTGVIEYCSLKDDESKNSGSSSDTSTQTPTGK